MAGLIGSPASDGRRPAPGAARFSLVIPAHNEEAYLPRLLDRDGDWHQFTMPFRIACDALRRRDTTVRRYWYERR